MAAGRLQHPLGGEEKSPRPAQREQREAPAPQLGWVELGSQKQQLPLLLGGCDPQAASSPGPSQHLIRPITHTLQFLSLVRHRPKLG